MAVQIVIDSASDFDRREAEEKGLTFLPLTVQWAGQTYRDQVDLPPREFYEKLIECSDLPTTGQLTPYDFTEAFRRLTENGDEVVAITLSSKLSGTFQSGMIAAGDFPGKAFVVDSLNATFGEHILVRYAIRLRDEGKGAEEIARELDQAKKRIRLIALVDTLEYLKRGGRISAVTAAAGGLLSIKPVISVVDGEVKVIGKARGSKKANNLLTELIMQSGGVNFDMPYALGFSGLDDSMLQKYAADSAELWQEGTEHLPVCAIGAVIGTHVGPGAVGAAFFSKE
ncbi:MAG: DegV family protein [Oscillibacter sp.]|nr:DegV family protein [Oscillibacter sp.]